MVRDPLVLNPGDLRHPVTIQSPSNTIDDYGQPSQTWTDVLSTRASIRALTLREMAQNSNLVSQVTHLITVRYPGNSVRVASGHRVVYGTQTFNVQAVDNVEFRNRVLRLQCIAIDAPSTAGDISA